MCLLLIKEFTDIVFNAIPPAYLITLQSLLCSGFLNSDSQDWENESEINALQKSSAESTASSECVTSKVHMIVWG